MPRHVEYVKLDTHISDLLFVSFTMSFCFNFDVQPHTTESNDKESKESQNREKDIAAKPVSSFSNSVLAMF